MTQYEREEKELEDELADGRITQAEYNAQVREMERAYRQEMRESAQDAYDRELERW